MMVVNEKHVTGDRRSVMQQARLAIRDVFDAIVELVTNSDDRYQLVGGSGLIQIEVERGRGKTPRQLRVRDFADGMTLELMDKKLSTTGGRVSGMEEGHSVRGTNSRGAKDIAALGSVMFESIAASDGRLHTCEITETFVFKPKGTRQPTEELRESTGLEKGSGMLVTITLGQNQPLPQHDNLRDKIQRLVALREVLTDPHRNVVLRDSSQKKSVVLTAPAFDGKERVKETIDVPGYPGATAKLVIARAGTPFERETSRFRLGGIMVKSRRAVHEATYFDSELEADPHALWFYGRLTCPFIDDLSTQFDDRFEAGKEPDPTNQVPILDPSRQGGLTRGHPFVQALFREALKRLRPLVEEERQREENQRASVENDATRRRLNALEKAAAKFMQEFSEDEATARDPDRSESGSRFKTKGYALNPPFVQLLEGHSQKFWLTVDQAAFPELEVGANVQVECLSADVTTDKRFVGLQPHPAQEGVLRALWSVKALAATPASGIRARVGPITAESAIEVFKSEADKYADVTSLRFGKKRYHVYTDGGRRKICVFAPLKLVPQPQELTLSLSSRHFSMSGSREIGPRDRLGVAMAEFLVRSDGTEASGRVTATLGGSEVSAELQSIVSPGAGMKIKLEDIDLTNQRYRWKKNLLEIAARYPSLSRYLGPKALGFPGQGELHFRLLLAEIVAEAVCTNVLAQNIQARPEEFQDPDWDMYYAEYTKLMARFLPVAHKLQCPEGG